MKRQKYALQRHETEDYNNLYFTTTTDGRDDDVTFVPLQKLRHQRKLENTIEAKVQDGDTLSSLALRFHCTVSDIKRLNKIDKDNEIYARKVVKIPVTVHSVLLETLPAVHKSGNNSPKQHPPQEYETSITKNPLEDKILSEKLLVASVNLSANVEESNINSIILNSTVKSNGRSHSDRNEDFFNTSDDNDQTSPLLSGYLDESIPQPRPIAGPSVRAFDCSGSDCDISWVFLLIVILALCFAIPLIYVFYIAEHDERFHHGTII